MRFCFFSGSLASTVLSLGVFLDLACQRLALSNSIFALLDGKADRIIKSRFHMLLVLDLSFCKREAVTGNRMLYLDLFWHSEIAYVVMPSLKNVEKRIVCGVRRTASITAVKLSARTSNFEAAEVLEIVLANFDELVVECNVFMIACARIVSCI